MLLEHFLIEGRTVRLNCKGGNQANVEIFEGKSG